MLWSCLYTVRVSLTGAAMCINLINDFVKHNDIVRIVIFIFYCANTTVFHMSDWKISKGGRRAELSCKWVAA